MTDTKTNQLILVPLEPLAERYTESWYRNLPPLFSFYGFDVTIVDGVTLEDEVKVGTFLDINSTTHYKFTQLQQISKMFHSGQVKDGCVFFFSDTEFWGLESVRLLAQMNKVKIYITSFCHAASYTREDAFSIAAPYQRYTEVGWFSCCDLIFVGSNYHKQQIIKERLRPLGAKHLESRIVVSKNPLFLDDYPAVGYLNALSSKQKRVLLTNRFDVEKRPNETLEVFSNLKLLYPDWEFIVTTGRSSFRGTEDIKFARDLEAQGVITIKANLTKAQYHKELAMAAIVVTHSIEENYGMCIAEALLHKCHVVARRGLSHDEFLPLPYLFDDETVSAYSVLVDLMDTYGTRNWPPVPIVDTYGSTNIAHSLSTLVKSDNFLYTSSSSDD